MTETLKKQELIVGDINDYYKRFYKAQYQVRLNVLNYLFRNITFLTNREKIRAITIPEYQSISKTLEVPQILVHKFISRFLVELINFKRLLNHHPEILHSHSYTIYILLRKLHRMAPIFNFKRAKENVKRLHQKLATLYFWPQVMTQLAIVIFVTDLLDKSKPSKFIQSNLRALCCCSAYAFHRTRNKIGLTSNYIKKEVS
ncbi:MAG: hypothetical protein JSV62_13055 [Promethearchaeota archaeon]|nr:MAG: hypothetical protein JSV62_13055 [Candidatus Lokiarchaeota archaeon]